MTAVLVELIGVLVVGALSLFDAVNFPHETVWSLFGRGYGFIPLLLPILASSGCTAAVRTPAFLKNPPARPVSPGPGLP